MAKTASTKNRDGAAWRPTREQLENAIHNRLPDLIAPNLKVLFVGINPGLYTAAIGKHFGHPGNRFWPALHAGGFTPRRFTAFEREEFLKLGYGIVNVVGRPTRTIPELSPNELVEGGKELVRKIRRYTPRFAAFTGVTAYRIAFGLKDAKVGPQDETIGSTKLWILPDPSGLNAHYPPKKLAVEFARLREAIELEMAP
jgi:double-stranded uracil-DNA glycosylase